MIPYPSHIIVKVLYQEFPDLAKQVTAKIRERIPETTFTEVSQIENLVQNYCQQEGIEIKQLCNIDKSRNNSYHRRVILALIIKLYHPEIISSLVSTGINVLVSKQMKELFNVSTKTFSIDLKTAKMYYSLYLDFKNKVDSFYNKIIDNHGNEKDESTAKAI